VVSSKRPRNQVKAPQPDPSVSIWREATNVRLEAFQRDFPERAIQTPQGVWRCRATEGRSTALPTLALPGIQGTGDVFFDLALNIGDTATVIAATAPAIEDVAQMTASTLAFVEAAGWARVNLLGASLGGYLVQAFANVHPERVEQLIISNGFYDPAPFLTTAPAAAEMAAAPADELMRQGMGQMRGLADDDAGKVALKAVMDALVGRAQTPDAFKSRMLLLAGAPALPKPAIAEERVMLIDDDHDPMMPPGMRNALRVRFAAAEQHALPGGGHMPAIQRPNEFAALVLRRLGG
jgi:pimeloyl-ACP methyl ester carboxylesterase